MINPWNDLPESAPFVINADKPFLPKIRNHSTDLKLDIRPEPYVGRLENARLVLLLLNPGYVPEDIEVNNDPYYQKQNRENLRHSSTPAFYYLDERLSYSGGYKWWAKKLKGLLREGFSPEELADKIMCVEYLPYHSVNYRHSKTILPSQTYSFSLVEEAIRMNIPIVVMRSERIWKDAVPALENYSVIKLKNVQNCTISRNNMNVEDFERIIGFLKD